MDAKSNKNEVIYLAGGCFWCIEAVFQQLNGVESAVSGYMGGTIKNPSYREVCAGVTGHAEVVELKFNSQIVSLHQILSLFFEAHDPTTLNRQGADVGTQYRSAVFYTSDYQKKEVEMFIEKLSHSNVYDSPIVTIVEKAPAFYRAEDNHQNYYSRFPDQPYCRIVIMPKLRKLQKYNL